VVTTRGTRRERLTEAVRIEGERVRFHERDLATEAKRGRKIESESKKKDGLRLAPDRKRRKMRQVWN
jgi:hypothetical protein